MKTTKRIITTTFIIFCYSFSYGQMVDLTPSQWLMEHKKCINSTPYIFEGTVLKRNYFRGKNQVVYTCIIQISKIFKGTPKIKLGTIKVITLQRVKNGDIIEIPSDGEGGINLSTDNTYIVFCRNANSSWIVDSTATDNTITLTSWLDMDYPIVISGKDDVSWEGTQFKTKEDIYSFFKESGVTVQEEAK
jgi:hypothetical protein